MAMLWKAVFVNYNYTPDWLKDYPDLDWIMYDRSDTYDWLKGFPKHSHTTVNADFRKILYTKNVGNADYDRLTFLIDNYGHLPKVFLLSKSNLFNYITKEEFDKVKDNKVFTPLFTQNHKIYEPICRYNNGMFEELNNSWYAPQFKRKFDTYNDWADYMGLPKPKYLQFAPGGNYILTPKEIHKHPKEFYIKMRDTLEHAVLPAEAHYVERSYYQIWR